MSSVLIYCDANVYLDYFFDRRDNMRPLGEFAFRVFQRAFGCEFRVAVSDWVLTEIRKNGAEKQMSELSKRLRESDKLVEVFSEQKDFERAEKLPTHYEDALHVALALKCKASFLVTSNTTDFLPCSDLIECVLPMNL